MEPPLDITASPELFPLVLDVAADRVAMVRLSEARYRDFSFLDERILPQVQPPTWTPWTELEAAAGALAGESDFIFHIGHVGSTLLSRLLGASDRVFCVREPAILRTLAGMAPEVAAPGSPWADEDFQRRLDVLLRLWARTWRPSQKSLVKATSFVSEIAPLILARSPTAKAILMYVSPRVYLATILGGPNSRVELKITAPTRLARLHRRLGRSAWRLGDLGEGEMAAMGWACEVMALAAVAAAFPDRVLWLDFEAFLARPAEALTAVLRRLHGDAREDEVAAMLRSPDLGRYSKAPEHAYDADLRRRVLAQARAEHGEDIERGVAWLNAAGSAHRAIGDAARMLAAAARGGVP